MSFHKKCPDCGREFLYDEEEQQAGFRTKDSLNCPYCGHLFWESMEVEFTVRKTEE